MEEKKKMTLVPGESYEGRGGVNEYGETWFSPKGEPEKRPGNMKLVKETDHYSLYESANNIKIAIVIKKELTTVDRIKRFMSCFQKACVELRNYKMS